MARRQVLEKSPVVLEARLELAREELRSLRGNVQEIAASIRSTAERLPRDERDLISLSALNLTTWADALDEEACP